MAAVAGLPGPASSLTLAPHELTEYAKILKLRDEIFAGIHPRLKVPAHAVRNLSPPSTQAAVSATSRFPTTLPETRVPGLNLSKPSGDVQSLPGLTPNYLTKSDELVRAEIQLQRQRLEKQLREQAEHKRNEARSKAAVAEAKPDFDVTEVFETALELVKPVTLSELQEANAVSIGETSDDNSFYSSRAPDSTPEDGEDRMRTRYRRGQGQAAIDLDGIEGESRLQHISDDIQQAGHAKVPGLGRHDSRAYVNSYQQPQDPSDRYSPPDAQPFDDDDEPEYSPPEAAEPMLAYAPTAQKPHHGRRSSGRYSPSNEVRINRRFGGDSNRRQTGGMESERTSPEMQTLPRKRRKVQEGRKNKHQKKGAHSPGAAIKDEPVSPPPFHDVPPLGTSSAQRGERADRPVYVDVGTPDAARYVPVERPVERAVERVIERPVERPVEYQPRPVSYIVDSPPNHLGPPVRSVSRPIYREVARDTQDLRRVASLQHMQGQQSEYSPHLSAYPEPPIARAPTYTMADRQPVRATSVMYEAPPRQYLQENPTSTSPVYREEYAIERPLSRGPVMAAPPPPPLPQRRIIVDEAGNRYYETIAPPREMSMAPPHRQIVRDPYDGPATQYVRATTVFEPPPPPIRETRYVQEMPPPPPFSNRISVAPRAEAYERPVYAPHEPSIQMPSQRGGSVQVVDYPVRQQSVFVDDRRAPREEYVRMSSVRPLEPYPQERIVQHVSNVRPMERAVSVFADDRSQLPREYVPANQPQYAMAPPAPTEYYSTANGTPMGLDGAREVRYSMVPQQRY